MWDSDLGALIVWGVLLAICLIGLFTSQAAASRIESTGRRNNSDDLQGNTGQFAPGMR